MGRCPHVSRGRTERPVARCIPAPGHQSRHSRAAHDGARGIATDPPAREADERMRTYARRGDLLSGRRAHGSRDAERPGGNRPDRYQRRRNRPARRSRRLRRILPCPSPREADATAPATEGPTGARAPVLLAFPARGGYRNHHRAARAGPPRFLKTDGLYARSLRLPQPCGGVRPAADGR